MTQPGGASPEQDPAAIGGRLIGVMVVGLLTEFSGYMPLGGLVLRSCRSVDGLLSGGMCERL